VSRWRGHVSGVSTVTPRFLRREERLGGFFCYEDRSTGLGEPLSARLSRSSASVRSIARALTAWRRSTSSPASRLGSLRATSRSVCVIASGVRSSWRRWLRISAVRRRVLRAATAWHRSCRRVRGTRLTAFHSIRWEAIRLPPCVGVGDAGQGLSMRPARTHPPRARIPAERQHFGYARSESAQEVGPVGNEPLVLIGCWVRIAEGRPTQRRAAWCLRAMRNPA